MTGGAAMEDPNILALLMHTNFADKSEQNKMVTLISCIVSAFKLHSNPAVLSRTIVSISR
eukprot:scaffold121823_cov19-Prasinocladus_malaysianus.AAC.1